MTPPVQKRLEADISTPNVAHRSTKRHPGSEGSRTRFLRRRKCAWRQVEDRLTLQAQLTGHLPVPRARPGRAAAAGRGSATRGRCATLDHSLSLLRQRPGLLCFFFFFFFFPTAVLFLHLWTPNQSKTIRRNLTLSHTEQ